MSASDTAAHVSVVDSVGIPADFDATFRALLTAVFGHVDGDVTVVSNDSELSADSAAPLIDFIEGADNCIVRTDGAAIVLTYNDAARAAAMAERITPTATITDRETGTVDHIVAIEGQPEEIEESCIEIDDNADDGFMASQEFPVPVPIGRYDVNVAEEVTTYKVDGLRALLYGGGGASIHSDTAFAEEKVERRNDAEVYGDISDDILQTKIRVAVGQSQEEKKWTISPEAPFVGFLDKYLTQHQVGQKNGPCFVTGSLVDKTRSKNAVTALYMLGLDVDSGASLDDTFETIRRMGLFAVAYTTHSHLTDTIAIKQDAFYKWAETTGRDPDFNTERVKEFLTEKSSYIEDVIDQAEYVETVHNTAGMQLVVRTRPIDKFRLVFLLEEPYVIAEQNMAQRDAILQWERLVMGMGAKLGIVVDRAARDPSRLFFYPRHPKGTNTHRILINGSGRKLDWKEVEQVDPKSVGNRAASDDPFENAAHVMGARARGRPTSPNGFDLMTWAAERGDGFMISEVFKDHAEDRLRGEITSGKFTVECPFDDEHSDSGNPDDKGCYIEDAGGSVDQFQFRCSHNSCVGRDRLVMMEKALVDGWFPDTVLTDNSYDCVDRPETVETVDEETGEVTEEKSKNTTEVLSRVQKLVSNANATTNTETLSTIMELLIEVSEFDRSRMITDLAKKAGVAAKSLNNLYKEIEATHSGTVDDKSYDPEQAADGARKKFKSLRNERRPIVVTSEEQPVAMLRHFLSELNRANRGDSAAGLQPAHALFDFGDNPVRIWKDDNGKRRIDGLDYQVMISAASELLYICKVMDKSSQAEDFLPDKIAKQAVVSPRLRTLPLKRFVQHPVFAKDGSLLIESGYHSETGCFLDNDIDLSNYVDLTNPVTMADVSAAAEVLDYVFGDFRWGGYSEDGSDNGAAGSRAAYYALLLAPLIREMWEGNQLIFGIDKPLAGSGGTLLAQCAHIIWTGEAPELEDYPTGRSAEEELPKKVLSLLMAGRGAIIFDNVKGKVASAIIPVIATGKVSGRVLGGNRMFSGELRYPLIFVGNELAWSDENARRVLPIRIDPTDADDKANFNVNNLIEHLKQHRAAILGHLITIVRWWIQQARPKSNHRVDSFEEFVQTMGGILAEAGIEGWLDGREAFLAETKKDMQDDEEILQLLTDKYDLENEFPLEDTYPQLFRELDGGGPYPRYEALFTRLAPAVQNGSISAISLGRILGYLKRKPILVTHKGKRVQVRLASRRSGGRTLLKVTKYEKPPRGEG